MSGLNLAIGSVLILVGMVGGMVLYERYPFVTVERVCKSVGLSEDVKKDIDQRGGERAPALDLVKAEGRLQVAMERLEKLKSKLPRDLAEKKDDESLTLRYDGAKKDLVKREIDTIGEEVAGFCAGLTTVQGK